MDQVALVDRRIDDGQRLIAHLVHDDFDVKAAFWLKPNEESRWHLYIASKTVDELGPLQAYQKLLTSQSRLRGNAVPFTDVKLIATSHPLARDVVKIQKRNPSMTPVPFLGAQLGGMTIEEAYLYPTPKSNAPRHVLAAQRVRLKSAVDRVPRTEELLEGFTADEINLIERLAAGGYERARAEYWVRQQREARIKSQPPIPAGTIVKSWVKGWWGDSPEHDPNPLLEIEAEDGSQGLTFKENTEPA